MATVGQQWKMHTGTLAAFNAKKTAGTLNANDFYYISDTKQLFLGADLYSAAYEVVTALPTENIAQGKFYVNSTDGTLNYYTGTEFKTVLPTIETAIDTTSTDKDGNIATIGAIKGFIQENGGLKSVEDTTTIDLTLTEDNKLSAALKVAEAQGTGVTVSTTDGLKVEIAEASADAKGIVQLATNAEALAGTDAAKAVTPAALKHAIAKNIAGAVTYVGAITADSQPTEAQVGDMFAVTADIEFGGVQFNTGDFLIFSKELTADDTVDSTFFNKIDNTEATDLVKLDATQTLTNKTIDATANTISNLATSNFKEDAIAKTISDKATAVDTKLVTEKAVADAIQSAAGDIKVEGSNSIEVATGNVLNVKLSAAGGNALSIEDDGLYAAQGYISGSASTDSVEINVSGSGELTANVKLATGENAGNVALESTANGLKATMVWEAI